MSTPVLHAVCRLCVPHLRWYNSLPGWLLFVSAVPALVRVGGAVLRAHVSSALASPACPSLVPASCDLGLPSVCCMRHRPGDVVLRVPEHLTITLDRVFESEFVGG